MPALPSDAPKVAIVGAGPTGLLFALALRDIAKSITIFERNPDPTSHQFERLGYAILAGGVRALRTIDPRIETALRHGGAVASDPFYHVRFIEDGILPPRSQSSETSLTLSRQLLDIALPSMVYAEPNVEVMHSTVRDMTFAKDSDRIELIDDENRTSGPYNLVIDATGRTRAQDKKGPTSTALRNIGLTVPVESYEPNLYIESTVLRLPPEVKPKWNLLLENPTPPKGRIGGQLMHIEEGLMQIGLGQRLLEKNPPVPFEQGIEGLPNKVFANALHQYDALYPPRAYRFREAYARRFDLVESMPPGLIVAGDAYMSTNPVYGMGISNAAIAAVNLKRCLQVYGEVSEEFNQHYYSSVWGQLRKGWKIGYLTDLMYYPEGKGTRLAQAMHLLTGGWRWRFLQDATLTRQLIGAANLLPEYEMPLRGHHIFPALARSLTRKKPAPRSIERI